MTPPQVLALIGFCANLQLAFGAPLQFVERPSQFAPGFPDPDSFMNIGGRRLEASDGRPARTRYVSEQSGHKFVYEFAGTNTANRVINLDKELGVSGVSCDQDRMWLRTTSGSEADAAQVSTFALHVGDVLTGGPEWGCHRNGMAGFMVEVLSVELDGSAIVVGTRDTSPLAIFRDLFIDFTWLKAKGPDSEVTGSDVRRLRGNCSDGNWCIDHDLARWNMSLNYDEATKRAKEPLDWGLLECSNCYAKMDTVVRFQLIGKDFDISRVALSLDAELDFYMQVKASEELKDLVGKGWTEVDKILGDDILKGIVDSLDIPFFNEWNDAFLKLELKPKFSMSTWVEVKENISDLIGDVLDSNLTAFLDTSGKAATWEAYWDKEDGFGVNVPSGEDFNYGISFDGWKHPDGLLTKVKQCFGVDLRAFGKSMTGMSLCPEQENIIWEGSIMNIPKEFLKTYVLPDAELCMDIKKFDTNLDKNLFALDTVFGQACFQGKCVETSPKQYEVFKSDVKFNDGSLCIPVRRSWVESSGIFLHAFEHTLWPGWNQYTTPLEVSLPQVALP
jgi:hypothetical protein